MTNIITYADFVDPYVIANAQESPYVQSALTNLITNRQAVFLRELLGDALYPEFITWYESPLPRPAGPFNDFLNGGAFTGPDGKPRYWVGIKKPLTAYVYYWFQRGNATQTVSSGEAKTESQNATSMPSADKMAQMWNEARLDCWDGWAYLYANYGQTVQMECPDAQYCYYGYYWRGYGCSRRNRRIRNIFFVMDARNVV